MPLLNALPLNPITMLPAPGNGRSRTDAFRAWDSGPPDRLFKMQAMPKAATPLFAAIFSPVSALNALIARLPTTMKQLFSYMPLPPMPLQSAPMPPASAPASARPPFGSPPRAVSAARMASPSWRSPLPASSPSPPNRCSVHSCTLRMAHSHFVVQQHPRIDRISFRFPTPAPSDSKRDPTTVIPGPARAPLAAAVPVAAAAPAVAAAAVAAPAAAIPSRSLKRSGDPMSTPPPRYARTSIITSPAAAAALSAASAPRSAAAPGAIPAEVDSKEEKKTTALVVETAISGGVECMQFNKSLMRRDTSTAAPPSIALNSALTTVSSSTVVVAPAAAPLLLTSPSIRRPPPTSPLAHRSLISQSPARDVKAPTTGSVECMQSNKFSMRRDTSTVALTSHARDSTIIASAPAASRLNPLELYFASFRGRILRYTPNVDYDYRYRLSRRSIFLPRVPPHIRRARRPPGACRPDLAYFRAYKPTRPRLAFIRSPSSSSTRARAHRSQPRPCSGNTNDACAASSARTIPLLPAA